MRAKLSTSQLDLVKNLPGSSQTDPVAADRGCVLRVVAQNTEHSSDNINITGRQQCSGAVLGDENDVIQNLTHRKLNDNTTEQNIDYTKANASTKTVIFLQAEANIEDAYHSSLLADKGFSRSSHLAVIYGTLLVLVGITFPVTEALQNAWMTSHVVAVFMSYLFFGATVFILYLEIYEIILKKRQIKKIHSEGNRKFGPSFAEREEGIDTERDGKHYQEHDLGAFNQPRFDVDEKVKTSVEEKTSSASTSINDTPDDVIQNEVSKTVGDDNMPSIYANDVSDDVFDYIIMHHGTATIVSEDTNFFLKIGLLVFAVANLVYVALHIEGDHQTNKCEGATRILYPHYVHLVFLIVQTFFLAKTCKRALRKHKVFVNFGLMHLVATNLCVWFRYLVVEVVERINTEEGAEGNKSNIYISNSENTATNTCTTAPVVEKAGHYLFPFILEYSLIAMSSIISMYSNINLRVTGELYRSVCESLHRQRIIRAKGSDLRSSDHKQSGSVCDLERSHRGLMMGLVVLAGVIVSIILFFYWKETGDIDKAQTCHDFSELAMQVLFVVNTTAGMCQLYHFIFNPSSKNTLDHVLLLIAANFLLVLELFIVLSKINYLTDEEPDLLVIVELILSIIGMLHAILQVTFIIDGMQRVSVKEKDFMRKKGRGVITFLIILNAAMWIFESFQEKYTEQIEEIETYGDVAWAIISSVSHPLQLFFYFHSAICLAHMWHHCYKQPKENAMTNNIVF